MRKLIFTMLLIPLLVVSQSTMEYPVIENGMITANPTKVKEFEKGMAAHNKKYHAEGAYGARVYWISNGTNVGKYMWVMGPLTWSAMDTRPAKEGHDEDWNTNILPYTMAEGDQTYWRFHPALSNFPKDFNLKYLRVMMLDMASFKEQQFLEQLDKVAAVMKAKYPNEPYGMYTNEMPNSKDGRDFAFVDFFDKMSFLGREDTFPKDFAAVHGEGSWESFLNVMAETTNGMQSELWMFREDLSGLGPKVIAMERQ
ncbi:hypothetical protein [Sediminicola sp. 1XM1-17]|uniref:hypothetical protein n=1 Tax=Sediminicola sp. 1XM1-17 TaxID=3127702 RepID=UPI00307893B4